MRRGSAVYICAIEEPEPYPVPNPDCPRAELHTPAPHGYLAWHDWAARMAKTHRQQECPGCGRWQIWMPRRFG